MRIRSLLKASFFVIPALIAVPASAQDGATEDQPAAEQSTTPRDPNAIQGSLQAATPPTTDHRIQLQAGKRYNIVVTSENFDVVAALLRPGSDEAIAEDDDSGGGTNAKIVYAPTQSGEYVVRVHSFDASGAGDYALSVQEASPLPALVTRASGTERAQWQVFRGDLSNGDAQEGGKRYDDYQLQLTEGQSAILQVLGADTDTMLQVFTADGRGVTPMVEDDDSGGNTNPILFFNPGEAGTYVVRVIGFAEDTRGAYRLRVLR